MPRQSWPHRHHGELSSASLRRAPADSSWHSPIRTTYGYLKNCARGVAALAVGERVRRCIAHGIAGERILRADPGQCTACRTTGFSAGTDAEHRHRMHGDAGPGGRFRLIAASREPEATLPRLVGYLVVRPPAAAC